MRLVKDDGRLANVVVEAGEQVVVRVSVDSAVVGCARNTDSMLALLVQVRRV